LTVDDYAMRAMEYIPPLDEVVWACHNCGDGRDLYDLCKEYPVYIKKIHIERSPYRSILANALSKYWNGPKSYIILQGEYGWNSDFSMEIMMNGEISESFLEESF